MQEPKLKREFAITRATPNIRLIAFEASADIAIDLQKYGNLYDNSPAPGQYHLYVSSFFDFDEVLEYMDREYGDPPANSIVLKLSLTEDQAKQIKEDARNAGFDNISDYASHVFQSVLKQIMEGKDGL